MGSDTVLCRLVHLIGSDLDLKRLPRAADQRRVQRPIAQRLGISRIKVELDDLALKYLEPEAYYDLVDKIAIRKSDCRLMHLIGSDLDLKRLPCAADQRRVQRLVHIGLGHGYISKGRSRDWLNVVKSTQAKNKINQWFKHELKEDNIVKGKELIAS